MKTRQDVMTWAEHEPTLGSSKLDSMKIAVAGLIFDRRGRILLHCRGHEALDANGCLEGIGGTLEVGEDELKPALQRELEEELTNCEIVIESFLVCSHLTFVNTSNQSKDWAVVTFVCRLVGGEPTFVEINRMDGIGWFDLEVAASWRVDDRPLVQLIDYYGNSFETEAGVSIWVPTVVAEYCRQRDSERIQLPNPQT